LIELKEKENRMEAEDIFANQFFSIREMKKDEIDECSQVVSSIFKNGEAMSKHLGLSTEDLNSLTLPLCTKGVEESICLVAR
jgi:hypothetical protein